MNVNKIKMFSGLKNKIAESCFHGDYKAFKTSLKQYATEAIKDYQSAQAAPSIKFTVPMFSKPGLRMFKCWFLNKFRSKTPAEKQLKKMVKEFNMQQEFMRYKNTGLM